MVIIVLEELNPGSEIINTNGQLVCKDELYFVLDIWVCGTNANDENVMLL